MFSHPKEMKDHLLEEWRDLKDEFGREGKTVAQVVASALSFCHGWPLRHG